ncbi:MAG: hypothetical protein AAFY00_05770, partial [Bacteroidota bacterium]
WGNAQDNSKISTMDFVQILNENREEALYYFQNNWKVLREMALKRDYIHSFDIFETPASENAPFELILVTTYKTDEQYDAREEHFRELIDEKGELDLMNDKKPDEFRKTLFNKENITRWD